MNNTADNSKKYKPASEYSASDDKAVNIQERISLLGIPEAEMTENVRIAVSALLEKIDDINSDLEVTKESLADMEKLVDVDCIAPIPNRRAFMRRLNWAINMYQRYGHPSSVLYLDLNDFKQINDQYGHSVGDLTIRHIAQLLTSAMRESDFLARIGGDEFAIIMHHASQQAAEKRVRIILEKLKATPIYVDGKTIPVSASCGVYSIKEGDDAEKCLSAADIAMYDDKRRSKSNKTKTAVA